MRTIYSFSIHSLAFLIRIASLFNEKAKLAIEGRKQWRKKLKDALASNTDEIIWIHVSSLGEFEQARPLIIRLKSEYPHYKILLTFFSPSGYTACKNFPHADWIFYMPYDTPKNAKDFLDIVRPKHVLFIKYEFWLNFLFEIQQRKDTIKCFLIASVFRKHQPFFKWYGGIFRKALNAYDKILVQDNLSLKFLKLLGKKDNVYLCGDTRVDRVIEIAKQNVSMPLIEEYAKNHRVIIAGSSWCSDEKIFVPVLKMLKAKYTTIRCIIAPHQPDNKNVQLLTQLLASHDLSYSRYTQLSATDNISSDVLIIDTIGILNKLYRYAHIAYIGGGFNNGIHNILEPAAYSIPIIFGKKHEKFYEAVELVRIGGAFCIQNIQDLNQYLEALLSDTKMYAKAQNTVKSFIKDHEGSVEKTIKVLRTDLNSASVH